MNVDARWVWVRVLFAGALLTACGGDDDASPAEDPQPLTSCPRVEPASIPTLNWSACDPAPLECASLEVPVDHQNPASGRYVLDLIRFPAGDPTNRRGVVVVQQGGPGGSSVDVVRQNYMPIALGMPAVHAAYDIIAMDGRGVSADTRSDCFGVELRKQRMSLDHTPDDDAGWAKVDEFWKNVAADCNAQHPIERVSTFGTCETVSDFDLLRAALGETELNYIGFSYGTLVGAAYASTYPEHVRAFVLDGAVLPATDFPAARTELVRVRGYDAALLRAATTCSTTASCPFAGRSAAQIVAEVGALSEQLDDTALVADGREVNDATLSFALKRALNASLMAALWPAIAAAQNGDGAPLLAQADQFGPNNGRQFNLVLNDKPCPAGFDIAAARALADAAAKESPLLGRSLAEDAFICLGWAEPPVRRPLTIAPTSAPPLLVVGGKYDVTTPGVWAQDLAQQLGNGSHVMEHELETHVAFPVSSCVRQATGEFIIDPTKPVPTRCTQ